MGQLARCSLSPGQVHDSVAAAALLDGLRPDAVVADKAYDTNALLDVIASLDATAVIPPKANRRDQRNWDAHHYKRRNLIERFFCRLKQLRRIATRYDKLMRRFESFIHLTAAVCWLA